MDMHDTIAIGCPCCKGELYQKGPPDLRETWGVHMAGAKVSRDIVGYFMKCPQCAQRIAFQEVTTPTGGERLMLSEIQRCGKPLS